MDERSVSVSRFAMGEDGDDRVCVGGGGERRKESPDRIGEICEKNRREKKRTRKRDLMDSYEEDEFRGRVKKMEAASFLGSLSSGEVIE
mmetsp:Transcript_15424/g.35746  ORF Transcript_15424/g.35746 Transcript_15424/m.35746 type:complete len:89 (-) Transcript_15424:61-327(-)